MTDQNTQMLGEIAMAIADDVPKEICLTVDGVRWLRDRYRDGQKAIRELEKIRTEKLAVRELAEEANAVSAARVCLSNAPYEVCRDSNRDYQRGYLVCASLLWEVITGEWETKEAFIERVKHILSNGQEHL